METHGATRVVWLIGAAITLVSSACRPDAVVDPVELDPLAAEVEADLDVRLKSLLLAASPRGSGLAYFMLPRGNPVGRVPEDPKNRLTRHKIELGKLLFHETALGVDNVDEGHREAFSCASCHFAQAGFQANAPQGIGEGGIGFGVAGEGRMESDHFDSSSPETTPDVQAIRSPSAMNSAYQQVMLWNGQFGATGPNRGTEARWVDDGGHPLSSNFLGFEGVETQAHAALAVHRMRSIELSRVVALEEYQVLLRKAFGREAGMDRLHVALAIAAYERSLLSSEAPFQEWLRGREGALTDAEKRGAILFFGEAGCVTCHTGPALNSMTFHALGMADLDEAVDPGRVDLRPFGGTVPATVRLGRGGFTGEAADAFKFKTPQLYNLADSPFYGHGASFGSVREVVAYFNEAVPQKEVGDQLAELFQPLGLTDAEVGDLTAFLVHGLYDANLGRYVPARLPSGNCTPVNDPLSQTDLGCD